ncbi:MAG TPA: MBL fold metallo-hydrolase [Candidatus Binatia bacterium]|nr:MBL fold metallo-hydrolase [Candidatus Binatia bacterium]
MVDDDFRVEVIGHATLRVQAGGRTLLTDPWLVDPLGSNSASHFPPLVHDPARLAAETDAIYVSHVHPDHFHRPSLALFPRTTPIYIGGYRRKTFRDELRRLGFPVVEVPFDVPARIDGTPFEVTVLEHDADEIAAFDSAIVIRTPEFTVFENNDCFLRPERYARVRARHPVDYAFLGYSPASFFPIAFELDPVEKAALLVAAADRRYGEFIAAAERLRPGLVVPFASGLRFLAPSAQWKNVLFNSAPEAARRARARGLRSEVMGPGDRIAVDGEVRRLSAILERDAELAAIARHADDVGAWLTELARREAPANDDVVERFRDYVLGLWRETGARLPGVRDSVIAYELVGPVARRFYFDFSRADGDVFQWGEPARYDMRYRYPAGALQQRLDGRIDWDELHFASDVSVHQVRYAKEFYTMLRSATLDGQA